MASQDTSSFLPPNRRASLHMFSRPRPMTSCGVDYPYDRFVPANLESKHAPTTIMLNPETNRTVGYGGRQSESGLGIAGMKDHPVDPQSADQSQLRRSASKSLSSFRSGAHEITSLVRKMSQSLRSKNNRPKQDLLNVPRTGTTSNEPHLARESSILRSKGSMWFRTQRPNRRPSLPLLNQSTHIPYPHHSINLPVPGTGPVPPIVPQNLHQGAAARAAAAAQNEAFLESTRPLPPPKPDRGLSHRFSELRLTRDSESGIGIELRDQAESMEDEEKFIRQDPSEVLPTEIMEQIFAYLDPSSLMDAQLVCSHWNSQARSRHVWRHTFHREYDRRSAQLSSYLNSARLPAAGLGKSHHDQNWKRMYKVRRALEARWQEGQAAAIYLNGHKDSVYCVQFDEQKIITGSRDQTIRIWDARSYQCIKIIGVPVSHGQHPIPQSWTPPLSPTGLVPLCSINTSSRDPVARKSSLPLTECHKASILCLQFDEEIMVTGSSDSTCIVWSILDNYAPVRRLRGHTAGVLDVCFDDQYIITCSKDTTICVWDRSTGELIKRLSGHRGPVNAVQLKGELVVSASGDGVAKLWNLASGLCVKEFPSRDRGLACVEFSDDGKTILAGGNDQVIYQFDANTAELVRELKGHKGLVRSLHLDTVNNRIVSGSYDMSIKVWDADKGCDAHDGGLKLDFEGWTTSWMLAAKSDYRRVVATSQDGRAVILDFGYGLEGVELLEG